MPDTKTPYISNLVSILNAVREKIESMESNFKPNMIKDYEKLSDDSGRYAADLIKAGCEFTLDDKEILIAVNDDSFTVPRESVEKYISKEQLDMLMDENEVSHEEITVAAPIERINENTPGVETKTADPFISMIAAYVQENLDATIQRNAKLAEEKKKEADVLDLMTELQEKMLYLQSSKREAELSYQALQRQFAEFKDSVPMLEEKNGALEISCKELDDALANARLEIAGLDAELAELKSAYRKLQEDKNISISDLNNTIKEMTAQKEDLKKSYEDKLRTAEIELRDANTLLDQKKKAELDSDKQIKRLNSRIQELEQTLSNEKSKSKSFETEIAQMKKSGATSKEEIEKLKSEYEKKSADYVSEINKLQEQIKKSGALSEEEIQKLTTLAYTDLKCRVKNLNAFNRDCERINQKEFILAMTGIQGMGEINKTMGREAGDNAIAYLCSRLAAEFGEDNVYRIVGDQFAILLREKDNDYSNISKRLNDIRTELAEEDLHIVYGLSVGSNYKDINSLANAAQDNLVKMKEMDGVLPSVEVEEKKVKAEKKKEKEAAKKAHNQPEVIEEDDDEELTEDEMLVEALAAAR